MNAPAPSFAPSAAADPAKAAAELLQRYAGMNLVDGALRPAAATLQVLEPATLAPLAPAAASRKAEVAAAVSAASAAFPAWAATPARARGAMLVRAAELIDAEAEALAILLARETGKALRTECRGELRVAADILRFYGGLGGELKGQTIPFDPGSFAATTREPLGVVAAILPWNVPLVLMALKIGPALVAGNAVVVKASEEAPFATLAVAEIIAALLPPGALNVVVGTGAACGAALTGHADVAKITFTGSEAAGRDVYRAGADRIIPVSLELGGKSPMIVCADADLPRAVDGAIAGMRFTRQGQSCTAASRIYVHRDLAPEFLRRLRAALDALVIGDPLDEATDVGTIVSAKQKATVDRYVALAGATPGAEVIRCGTLPTDPALSPALFAQPTLLLGLSDDHPCAREEIFGPVAVIQEWDDYEEVIARANDSAFGLAATVWTTDLATALDATRRLNAGYVQVNQNLTIQPNLSYGGFGNSGLGKEASLEAMVEHFTRSKTIVIAMG